ncbi:putative transcription elongation factor SPT5-like protein 1 [Hibiscus syriacus]|uniref:Transcription elongation factor SPT5-like protein 1 n=1 Tax=Hibiscus syriacus TaxID=106335 RepID=A0A6A3BE10_HIBSY|nr:putative transcription elongation factor SPT5-like protein 1 [Hibiscus syriacus]
MWLDRLFVLGFHLDSLYVADILISGNADFILETGGDLPDEDVGRRMHHRPLPLREGEQEDVEALERSIQSRYARSSHTKYDEETTDVEQQALFPSVRDPKLWMVKRAIGRERETVVCLMQKYIDKGSELQIRSVISLDHLKNYIYIEADKEAHVREAIKGLCTIFGAKIMLVPIRVMTDVLSVESKVVDVDNVRQRVTVKLILRIDLPALANKLEGREVPKKKAFVPPPRFMNVDEARELHIRVERRRDSVTVSMKSISAQNIKPTFDELEKFQTPNNNGEGGSEILKGWVEKVEEENVHIRPEMKGLPLRKYFELGNHVEDVSGTKEGATGMVVKVEQPVLIILSDTAKELIRDFADDVVESSEVTTGVTKIGEYELHDLVLLDNNIFGVIIRVESEAFQVLKVFQNDQRYRNIDSLKYVVRILDGPFKWEDHVPMGDSLLRFGSFKAPPRVPLSPRIFSRGGPPFDPGWRQIGGRGGNDALIGTTVKIRQGFFKGYRGRVVDIIGQSIRVELESQMRVVTGKFSNTSRYGMGSETPMHLSRTPLHPYMTPMRDPGATLIHDGMRTPMRDRAWNPYAPMSPSSFICQFLISSASCMIIGKKEILLLGSQSAPGSPSRAYEAPTPGSGWDSTPGGNYSEAGTPRDGSSAYANAPSPYMPSTPSGQPMTPSSVSYIPGTPGGQPMTPGTGGLDVISPLIGADNEGPWFMPDILVNVHKSGDETLELSKRCFSNTAESSVGGNLEVVRVIEHTRNKDIWDHYDLCEMSNGSRRARCKLCLKFLASEGNTTLKNHLTKSCKALRSRSDPSQSNLTPQGGVFVYDNEKLREAFTKFVITKALPFDHFDDEDFTTTIQQLMQPRYTQEAQFPILAAMARDLLTVQASTVASESAFSVSGRVISQRRSRLSPESVEVCICLKDYLDGAARKQHITTLEDAIDADLEANLHIEEVELGISPPNEEGEDDEEEMAM